MKPYIVVEDVYLSPVMKSFFALCLVRLNMIIFAYMFHNWFAMLSLLWIFHSMLIKSYFSFARKVSFFFYMPLILCLCGFYYLTNINGLIDKDSFEYDLRKYGIQEFPHQVTQVFFIHFLVFSFFLWIKYSEDITEENDFLEENGAILYQKLSRPSASSL